MLPELEFILCGFTVLTSAPEESKDVDCRLYIGLICPFNS